MIAKDITRETLEVAAAEIGVTIQTTTLNQKGTRHRVKVNPGSWKDADTGDRKYQRESAGYNGGSRRVAAVCWHGFRDYFRACFEREPNAVFRTAMDTWDGSEDFEERYRESGHRNIGSAYFPTGACEACRCPESGRAE